MAWVSQLEPGCAPSVAWSIRSAPLKSPVRSRRVCVASSREAWSPASAERWSITADRRPSSEADTRPITDRSGSVVAVAASWFTSVASRSIDDSTSVHRVDDTAAARPDRQLRGHPVVQRQPLGARGLGSGAPGTSLTATGGHPSHEQRHHDRARSPAGPRSTVRSRPLPPLPAARTATSDSLDLGRLLSRRGLLVSAPRSARAPVSAPVLRAETEI